MWAVQCSVHHALHLRGDQSISSLKLGLPRTCCDTRVHYRGPAPAPMCSPRWQTHSALDWRSRTCVCGAAESYFGVGAIGKGGCWERQQVSMGLATPLAHQFEVPLHRSTSTHKHKRGLDHARVPAHPLLLKVRTPGLPSAMSAV
jgi:hypothetical protein